jgi:hypothetical protein
VKLSTASFALRRVNPSIQGLQRAGVFRGGVERNMLPPETARAFLDLDIKPQNIYGMTENGSHQYTLPDDDVETNPGGPAP